MKTKILSTGHNLAALKTRNTVLEEAGYQVTTTRDTGLVSELVAKDHFEAVVICNSVPDYLRENLARELRRLRPTMPLVIICADSATEQERFRHLADEIVIAQQGLSQPLIDAVSRVVAESSHNRKLG